MYVRHPIELGAISRNCVDERLGNLAHLFKFCSSSITSLFCVRLEVLKVLLCLNKSSTYLAVSSFLDWFLMSSVCC